MYEALAGVIMAIKVHLTEMKYNATKNGDTVVA